MKFLSFLLLTIYAETSKEKLEECIALIKPMELVEKSMDISVESKCNDITELGYTFSSESMTFPTKELKKNAKCDVFVAYKSLEATGQLWNGSFQPFVPCKGKYILEFWAFKGNEYIGPVAVEMEK